MKKTMKILGIGAVALFAIMIIMPACSAVPPKVIGHHEYSVKTLGDLGGILMHFITDEGDYSVVFTLSGNDAVIYKYFDDGKTEIIFMHEAKATTVP